MRFGTWSAKATGGYFLDFDSDRKAAARFGRNVDDVQGVIAAAMGGVKVSETHASGGERVHVGCLDGRRCDRDSGVAEDACELVEVDWQELPAVTDAETAALAASGAGVVVCPITEANLGDGIFNARKYLSAGGALALGSDSNIRITLS